MVDEDDETSKDKEIDKRMALISLSFKKIYKPTNNNLRTSSNTSSANQDNSLRINRNAGYENQRNGNGARARETVGSYVVQKYGIQCYNCKEFGHVARECQKPKRAKDAAYHREKMLLCKQEEAGIQLNAKQADWRDDTDDDELQDQELEAHYMYMAQLQQVSPDAADSGPIFDDEPLQRVSNDDHYNVFAIESSHPEQSESVHYTYSIEQDAQNVSIDSLDMSYDREEIDQNDDDNDLAKERVLLASLIEKLKCEIDESKNRNKFLETSNKVLIEKLKDKLSAHQETISILSKQKEAQIKLYKTREDKELDKVIELENKVKTLSDLNLKLNKVTNLQCDYLELLEKCEGLETKLSKSKMMSKSFESVQKHAINLEFELQQSRRDCPFIVDSGCSKHMTGNLKLLINFVEKFLGTVKFRNDQIAPILGYGDLHMTGNLKLLINFVEKFLGTVKFGNDQIAPILGYGDLVQGAVTIKRS
nr:integrase, catalytic region, zinc finger, CCHC-type, peptidase aspartic, catalytic [Tanacetum cinerariifolium]